GELALAAFWAALCAFLSAFSSSVGGVGQGFSATGSPPNLAAMSLVDWAMPWAMRTTSWGLRSSASRRSKNRMSWFLISVGFPAAVYQEESCVLPYLMVTLLLVMRPPLSQNYSLARPRRAAVHHPGCRVGSAPQLPGRQDPAGSAQPPPGRPRTHTGSPCPSSPGSGRTRLEAGHRAHPPSSRRIRTGP